MVEPFSDGIVLERTMTIQDHLPEICRIFGILSLEAWKCQVLKTKGSELALNGRLMDILGDIRDVTVRINV
jgi:hypothetical protein